MLETLTREQFVSHEGTLFRLTREGGPVVGLTLTSATSLSLRTSPPGAKRSPFSLLFHGPLEPVLPQRIYALEHEALGRLEIFLVPLGPDAKGMRYEAIFN